MTSSSDTAITKAPIGYGEKGVQLQSFEDLYRFSKAVVESGLAPSAFRKPEQIIVAVQYGAELGLSPMQSLQSMAVIGGKPSLMVEPALAIVRKSGLLVKIDEEYSGEGDTRMCTAKLYRVNGETIQREFSMADARRAGLAGKDIWKSYPDRMLRARAVGFGLRDLFPDALRGIGIAEEQADIPREVKAVAVREQPTAPHPLLAQIGSGHLDVFTEPEIVPAVIEVESEAGSTNQAVESSEPVPARSDVPPSDSSPVALSAPIQAAIKQRIKMLGLTKSGEKVAAQRMESMVVDMLDLTDLEDESEILAAIRGWKMQ